MAGTAHSRGRSLANLTLISTLTLVGCAPGAVSDSAKAPAASAVATSANATMQEFPTAGSLRWAAAPAIPRPSCLARTPDPTFGARITRVSDQSGFASSSMFLRHFYSKHQPWNADGTLVLLDFTYP